jgi:hypothetical protein
MTGQPEPISWGALALALWPLWLAYAVILLVAIAGALSGRRL